MSNIRHLSLAFCLLSAALSTSSAAESTNSNWSENNSGNTTSATTATPKTLQQTADSLPKSDYTAAATPKTGQEKKWYNRLTLGGYGEAVYSRNFYSDDYKRYTNPDRHKDESHGRFDIPHAVIYLGYDFGKGWSMGSEIEFEHGGVETAVEIEKEESGEYETEVERGGEVNLEQFWIQKEFMPQLKVRAAHPGCRLSNGNSCRPQCRV